MLCLSSRKPVSLILTNAGFSPNREEPQKTSELSLDQTREGITFLNTA